MSINDYSTIVRIEKALINQADKVNINDYDFCELE